MADLELPPIQTREQRFSDLVGMMLTAHSLEMSLQAPQPELRSAFDGARLNARGTSYREGQSALLEEYLLTINYELLELDGIPCSYFNTESNQVNMTSLIGWHGLVKGRTDLHNWRNKINPEADLTMAATFLKALERKYIVDTNPLRQIDPRGYL